MKFGGLSEKEVERISIILEKENIDFKVLMDDEVMTYNNDSIKENLRHYSGAKLSTHVLSIDIPEGALLTISEESKIGLLDLGITTEVPDFEDTIDEVVDKLQNKKKQPLFLEKWGNRLVGLIIVGFVTLYFYNLLKDYF